MFEPGSIFKLVTASAALQEKVKKEDDILDGNHGVIMVNNEPIRDHEPFGKLTFAQAVAYSSNICFAKIGMELGGGAAVPVYAGFRVRRPVRHRLPGEERGILHPVNVWSGRTLATMSFGQEISVTLLQMMAAYAAIANNGVLVKPQICEKIVADDGTRHRAGLSATRSPGGARQETARRPVRPFQGRG